MEMKRRAALCEYFVVMSAPSTIRVKTIAEHIEEIMEGEGYKTLRREGYQESRWVVLDYGSILVHVFYEETRQYYHLENLWGDVPRKNYIHGHHTH